MDHADSSGSDLIVASLGAEENCSGTSLTSLQANESFKNGIISVVAIGNGNHHGDCNVMAPADATSSLAIGAHGNGGDDTITELDNSSPLDSSPTFGTAKGGHTYYSTRTRTIVDLLTPGFAKYYPLYYDNDGYETGSHNSTSMAAPKAAAALMDLMHERYNDGSSVIHYPGVQKVLMLLMGDRATGDGSTHLVSSFSDIWGAGRLNMRLLNSNGLDDPSCSCYGYACVANGEDLIVPINSNNALSSDVDRIKAVAWWYTDSFTNPIPNRIHMYLDYESSPGVWTVIRSSQTSDLKKRILASGSEIQGRKVRLRLYGYDVNSSHDDRGNCQDGKARVYYAFIFEDNDRDDADAPADFATINGL